MIKMLAGPNPVLGVNLKGSGFFKTPLFQSRRAFCFFFLRTVCLAGCVGRLLI